MCEGGRVTPGPVLRDPPNPEQERTGRRECREQEEVGRVSKGRPWGQREEVLPLSQPLGHLVFGAIIWDSPGDLSVGPLPAPLLQEACCCPRELPSTSASLGAVSLPSPVCGGGVGGGLCLSMEPSGVAGLGRVTMLRGGRSLSESSWWAGLHPCFCPQGAAPAADRV